MHVLLSVTMPIRTRAAAAAAAVLLALIVSCTNLVLAWLHDACASLTFDSQTWSGFACRYDKFSFDITAATEGFASSHEHELLVQVFDPTGQYTFKLQIRAACN